MAKKTFFFLLLCVTVVFLGVFFYFRRAEVVVADTVNGFIRPYAEMLAQEVNKPLKGKLKGRYTLYAANFEKGKPFPELGINDGKRILWLGSTRNYIPDLQKFDIVLTSTPMLTDFLKDNGDEAFYFPLFTDKLDILPRKGEFSALIGESPFVEDILKEQKLPYVKYRSVYDERIVEDMTRFQAVFVEGSALNDSSIDTHPIIFTLAAQKIPLATYWAWPDKEETVNLFNDEINFYMDKDDAKRLAQDFLQPILPRDINERILDARRLVKTEYSLKQQAKRLSHILQYGTPPETSPAPHSLNIDLGISVGHLAAGDFWVAKDLAEYMQSDGWHTSLTFFNSPIKYPADVNIILRGISANQEDRIGKINIYYLAYPQFFENNPKDNEFYYDNLVEEWSAYDAVATASKSLAEALTERGVKTHYMPQFTNHERFYPDYHEELKSEVLFVGVNAPYRRAAKIALNHKLPITIYGPNWGDDAKGEYVDNRILHQYYSSAKIVLNDTREEMLAHGVISNRIFDASASGALVISDYMPEIEEVYGDSVPMWKTDKELVALIKYYLDPAHEEERLEKAKRAQEITLKNFTAEQAADKFNEIIKEVKREK